jgi:hypothetical protein
MTTKNLEKITIISWKEWGEIYPIIQVYFLCSENFKFLQSIEPILCRLLKFLVTIIWLVFPIGIEHGSGFADRIATSLEY